MPYEAEVKGQYSRTKAYDYVPPVPVTADRITTDLLAFLDTRYGGGPGGVSAYNHDQPSGATEWIINHNLGYKPQVQAFTVGGVEIIGDILHSSDNQVRISFSDAQSGFARLL